MESEETEWFLGFGDAEEGRPEGTAGDESCEHGIVLYIECIGGSRML